LRLALLPSGNVAGAHEAGGYSFCGISKAHFAYTRHCTESMSRPIRKNRGSAYSLLGNLFV
jgi:hypothetical protein